MLKHSSHATAVSLPSDILALNLLHNADVLDSDKVLIYSAATSNVLDGLKVKSDDEIIDTVSYESVASVINQIVQGSSSSVQIMKPNQATFLANAVATYCAGGNTHRSLTTFKRKLQQWLCGSEVIQEDSARLQTEDCVYLLL